MPSRCPPGMICFPNKFDLISWPSVALVVILFLVIALSIWSFNNSQMQLSSFLQSYGQAQGQVQSQPQVQPVQVNVKGDDRYSRAPEAERVWNTAPDYNRIPSTPFNIPTQGVPQSYQSMGIVKTPDGKLLPLYGRRSISSRERYNYYTRTDTYNPIPIPVHMKGYDCQDQVGCPELYNGDTVKMGATNETGEVTIYRVSDIVR